MSSPHQQVVSSIQSSQSYSNAGRTSEPATSLLTAAGKQAKIAPLRDPRDASKRKRTTTDDAQVLAQQGLYAAAAENIKNEAKEYSANVKHQQQIENGMKRPASAQQAIKNAQSTIPTAANNRNNNNSNNNNRSSVMTPQPMSNNNNNSHQGRNPFVSRFAAFSPLDLISGLVNNNNSGDSTNNNNNTESRHETLVSSGRVAYVKKKRANSAAAGRIPTVGNMNANDTNNISNGNISQIGRKSANSNNNGNRPIVEALYTPDVEVDRRFLVSERIKAKEQREGKHANELSSFKNVPRPEAGDESAMLCYGGIVKTPSQKVAARKPPPVGAYNPHYEALDHKIQGFYFDSPGRTRTSSKNNNNNNNDPNNNNGNHQNDQQHNNFSNTVSQQFGSVGTFDFMSTSAANFASSGNYPEASLRTLHPSGDNDRHKSNQGLYRTPAEKAAAAKDLEKKVLQEELQRGVRTPTPDHSTFSAQGTSSFASKAPRFSTDSNKKDKKGNPVVPPPPAESPWPIVKVGSAVRPTGGGAIGAPLGNYTTPPDLPQKHDISSTTILLSHQRQNRSASTPPPHNNNNNNNNTSNLSGGSSQQPQNRTFATPKLETKVRKTFLDDLKASGASERVRADDVAIRPRLSTGVSFDKAAGRYGHTMKTAASLRFQPTRSVGRVADEEEVALKGAAAGASSMNCGPQEKFLDTSAVARVNTKDDSEVLSTKHRIHSGLTFDKQYGNHQDKHSVVAGGDQKLKPSSVMTSPMSLEHPYMSLSHSKIPGYVSLDKRGGGAKKNANYRKVNVFGDTATSNNNKTNNNNDTNKYGSRSTGALYGNDEDTRTDKTFIDLSYPRTRGAIILTSASEGHQDPSGAAYDGHHQQQNGSPSRFKFTNNNSNNISSTTNTTHHQQNNNSTPSRDNTTNKPLDDFRHVRSPAAFFPKTSHSSYIVTRTSDSGPTGKNTTKNNKISVGGVVDSSAASDPQPIPLDRLKLAEQATQPKTKGLFNISKTLSRDDRDRRWNAATREYNNQNNQKGGARKK